MMVPIPIENKVSFKTKIPINFSKFLVQTNKIRRTPSLHQSLLIVILKMTKNWCTRLIRIQKSQRLNQLRQEKSNQMISIQSRRPIKKDWQHIKSSLLKKWLLRTNLIWENHSLLQNSQLIFLQIWDCKRKVYNCNLIISLRCSCQLKLRTLQELS
jgi:hypothetical protein